MRAKNSVAQSLLARSDHCGFRALPCGNFRFPGTLSTSRGLAPASKYYGRAKDVSVGPGVGVNIVLKKDQQSGKLTRGRISEILTQGDHPRGVKVRLIDGSFGRVQSLSSDLDPSITVQNAPAAPTSRDMLNGSFENSTQQYGRAGRRGGKRESLLQENYSESSAPQQSRSLADYIKSPPSSKPASAPYRSIQGDTVQLQLEKDFPKLDTALIAAILSDHDDPEAARGILSSLD